MSERRFKILDLWRGLAALLIVVFHSSVDSLEKIAQQSSLSPWKRAVCNLLSHADIGVTIFFVISGYCITGAARNTFRSTVEQSSPKENMTLRFFLRRFFRIYPTYWIALATIILFDYLQLSFSGLALGPAKEIPFLSGAQVMGNLLLVETWRPLIFPGEAVLIVPVIWSLCYEEQFYFIMGVLIKAGASMFARIAVISGIVLLCHLAQYFGGNFIFSRLFLDGTWLYFAVGILVYYALHVSRRGIVFWESVVLVVASSFYLLGHLFSPTFFLYLTISTLIGAIFIILHSDDEVLSELKVLRPLMRCGEFSYSIYLIHGICCEFLNKLVFNDSAPSFYHLTLIRIPVSIIVSTIAAKLFYVLVERHFIPPKRAS